MAETGGGGDTTAPSVPTPERLSYAETGTITPENIELVVRDFREALRGIHQVSGDPEPFLTTPTPPMMTTLSSPEVQNQSAPCSNGGRVTTELTYRTRSLDMEGKRVMGAGDAQEAVYSNCIMIAQMHGAQTRTVLHGFLDRDGTTPITVSSQVQVDYDELVATLPVLDGVKFDDGSYRLTFNKGETLFASEALERRYIYSGNKTAGIVVKDAEVALEGAWSPVASGSMSFAGDQAKVLVEAAFSGVELNVAGTDWYVLGAGNATLRIGATEVELTLTPSAVLYEIKGDAPYSSSFDWSATRN